MVMGEAWMGILKRLFRIPRETVKLEESFAIQNLNVLTISVDIANVDIMVHQLPKVDVEFESYEGGPGLEVTQTENALTIISKKERKGPRFLFGDLPKCYLKIYVPMDVANNWDIAASSGIIHASNLVADAFRISATSGKINLSTLTAEKVIANTTSGKILLKDMKMEKLKFLANSGKVEIDSAYGDISGQVGSGSVFISGVKGEELDVGAGSGKVVLREVYMKHATIHANSGKIEAENFRVESTIAKVGSGKIDIRDFRGAIKGNANSGNINLSISENSELDLKTGSGNILVEFQEFELNTKFDIKTGSGSITTNLPMSLEQSEKRHFLGKAGNGENLIHLRTDSGNAVLYTVKSSLNKKGKGNKVKG
jgi:DUF4097 and DUF4098 domain-containing protein YvlB